MKTVITYIAFDGTRFSTQEKCIEYEADYINIMVEANECFEFYDGNMKLSTFLDTKKMKDKLIRAYNRCFHILVKKEPSDKLKKFLKDNIFIIPIQKGFWHYSFDENKWISTD